MIRRTPASRDFSVVITRPARQCAALAARVRGQGWRSLIFPLLRIEPVADVAALDRALLQLEQYALVVFVSPNALESSFDRLDALGLALPASLPLAVVGPGSLRVLLERGHEHGIRGIDARPPRVYAPSGAFAAAGLHVDTEEPQPAEPPRFDSEALLRALAADGGLERLAGRKVLLLRGDGGRETLAEALGAAGARVEAVSAYRRAAPQPTSAQWQTVRGLLSGAPRDHAWVVTSSEALRYLLPLAGAVLEPELLARLRQARLVVPHARIAETAQQAGFDRITLSGASDDGVIAALQALAPHSGTPV